MLSLEEFNQKLDEEFSWRKKELTNMENIVKSVDQVEEANFIFLACITLCYAHWEGGIKNFFEFYKGYLINKVDIQSIDEDWLLDLVFGDIVKTMGQNTKEQRIKAIKEFKNIFLSNTANIPYNINTKSNLKFKVLEDLMMNFNLPIDEQLLVEEKFINKLVDDRNCIAHGENKFRIRVDSDLENSKKIFLEYTHKLVKLLELIKQLLINKTTSQIF